MRLLAIILGSLLFFSLGLLSIRFWGEGQKFQAYDHIVYKQTLPLVFTNNSNYFNIDTDAKTGEFLVGNTPLESFIPMIQASCSVLNFKANLPAIHKHIEQWLSKNKILDSSCVVIKSETRNVAEALKNLMPRYIFASTPAENMKLISMRSMGLLPAAKISSDLLFIEPYDKHKRPLLSDSLVQEVSKQHKKIIVGPFINQDDGLKYLNEYSSWSLYGFWVE